MDSSPTPTYKLFGEKEIWPTSDLVHHETIAARSSLYDWKIAPHSHDNLFQVLLLETGHATFTRETRTEPLATPCVVLMPPRHIHGYDFSPDVVGHILTLPHFMVGELLALAPELQAYLKAPQCHALAGDAGGLALLRDHFSRFSDEYAAARPGRASALLAILSQILVWLGRAGAAGAEHAGRDRFARRVDRFHDLVDRHFREWRPVSFYAGLLGVSPTQLNLSCRRTTGHSAQQLIHQRMALEARRLLAYSELDVTAIGYSLGFRDQAYFSRFFTRTQDMTPSAFRKLHGRVGG